MGWYSDDWRFPANNFFARHSCSPGQSNSHKDVRRTGNAVRHFSGRAGPIGHLFTAGLAVVALYGSFQGIWLLLSVALNDMSAALAPFSKGAAMGLFNAAAAIVSAAIVGAAMADKFGYSSASLLAAAGTAAAFLCVFRLKVPAEPAAAIDAPTRSTAAD